MSVITSRVGSDLRSARERLGYTLPAIAAHLRIRLPFLEAIEDGRIADLPGNAYALGFIRTYAQALGLDPDEIARRFKAEAAEVNRKTELDFPAPVPERGIPAGAIVLLGVVIAIGAYVGWYRMSGRDRPEAEIVPPVPERLAALAPNPPSMPSVSGTIVPSNPSASSSPAVIPAAPPSSPVASLPSNPSTALARTPPQPLASPAPSVSGATGAPVTPPSVSGQTAAPPAPPASPVTSTANQAPTSVATNNAGAGSTVVPLANSSQLATNSGPAAAGPTTTGTTPATGDAGKMMLRAKADAWIQVREKQGGAILLNRVLRPGETWVVPVDKSQLLMTTGNAGGTELLVDGVVTASLGGDGAVRRDLTLDPEMAREGKLAPGGTPPSPTQASTTKPASPPATRTN